jgi:hypothetical protein
MEREVPFPIVQYPATGAYPESVEMSPLLQIPLIFKDTF